MPKIFNMMASEELKELKIYVEERGIATVFNQEQQKAEDDWLENVSIRFRFTLIPPQGTSFTRLAGFREAGVIEFSH